MASSRLEKIGTIFSRVNGLLKAGAMKWEDRPLWYDIYKTFPPTNEPKYDRPAPDIPVLGIFYEEDKIRAKYHKNTKQLGTINMFNNEAQTKTQKFIEIYKKMEASGSVSIDQLYDSTMDILKRDLDQEAIANNEQSLVNTFKEAQDQQNLHKIDIANILKE